MIQGDLVAQLGGIQKAVQWAVELSTKCIWRDFENQVAVELLEKLRKHRDWLQENKTFFSKKTANELSLEQLPSLQNVDWLNIEIELSRLQIPAANIRRIRQHWQQSEIERQRRHAVLGGDIERVTRCFPSMLAGWDTAILHEPNGLDQFEQCLISYRSDLLNRGIRSYWAIVREAIINSDELQGDRELISLCLRKVEEIGRHEVKNERFSIASNPYRVFFLISRLGKFVPRLFPSYPAGELTYWIAKHLRRMHRIKYNASFVSRFQSANDRLTRHLKDRAIQAEGGDDPDSEKYVRTSPLEILECFDGELSTSDHQIESNSPTNRLFLESLFLTGMVGVLHPHDFSDRFAKGWSVAAQSPLEQRAELDTKTTWRFYTNDPDTEYLLSIVFGIPVLESGLEDVFGGGVRLNDSGTVEDDPDPALPGRVLMVRGGYGSGKTLLSLSLAAAVARLGGLVFYIALEFDCEVVRFALARLGQPESDGRFKIVSNLEALRSFFQNRKDDSEGVILVSSLPKESESPVKIEEILDALRVFSQFRREVDVPRLIVIDPINAIPQLGHQSPNDPKKNEIDEPNSSQIGDREDLVLLRRKTLSALRQATGFGANILMIAEEDGTWTTFGEDIADVVVRLSFTRDRDDRHEPRALSISKSRLAREHRGPHPFRILSDKGIKISLCSQARGDSDRSRLFAAPREWRFGFYWLDKVLNPNENRISKFHNCGSLILIEGVLGTYKTQFGLAFLNAPLLDPVVYKRPVGLVISMRYDDEAIRKKQRSIECRLMIESEARQLHWESFALRLCESINENKSRSMLGSHALDGLMATAIASLERCIHDSARAPILKELLQSNSRQTERKWTADSILRYCNMGQLVGSVKSVFQMLLRTRSTNGITTEYDDGSAKEGVQNLRKHLFETSDDKREIRTCTLPTGYVFPGEILDRIKQEFVRLEREDARIDRVFLDNPGEWEDMCPLLSEDPIFADTLISFLRRRNVRILVTNRMVGSEDSKVIRAIVERVDTKIQLEQHVVGGRQSMLLHVARSPNNNHDSGKFEIHPDPQTGLSFRAVETFKRYDDNGRVLPLPVHILARRQSKDMSNYWENVGALIKASIASTVEYSETGSYGHRFAFHLSSAFAFDSLRLVEIDEFELQTAGTFLAPLDPANFSEQLINLKKEIRLRIDIGHLRAIPFFDNTSYFVVRKTQLLQWIEKGPSDVLNELPSIDQPDACCRAFLADWKRIAKLACHLASGTKDAEQSKRPPLFSFASREPENWNCLFLEIIASIDTSLEWNSEQCLTKILTREPDESSGKRELRTCVIEASRILWDLLESERSPSCTYSLQEPFDVANRNAILSRNWFTALHSFRIAPGVEDLDDLFVCRLPGAYSVSGQWYLGLLKNSAAIDVGIGLLQQLTSRKAEEDRLRLGIGLPSTKPPKSIHPAYDVWSRIHDIDYFEDSHVNVIDRSKISKYLELNHLLSRTLKSVVLLPEFDKEIVETIWQRILESIFKPD